MYGPGWGGGWRRRRWGGGWGGGWRRPMFGPYFGFGFPGCGCLFLLIFLALGACWFFTGGGFFHPYFFYR